MKIVFLLSLFILFPVIFTCEDSSDCSSNGNCILKNNTYVCNCTIGFMNDLCSYEQKKQSTGLILSILFGWAGLDRMYIDEFYNAIIKATAAFISFCGFLFITSNNNICKFIGRCITLFVFLALCAHYVFDIVMFATCSIYDSYGYSLYCDINFHNFPNF